MADKGQEKHWTADNKSYRNFIAEEFIAAIDDQLEKKGLSHKQFADLLEVSEGRVSQMFRNPGNLTLQKMVEYSRKLGLKISVLTYDDDDPENFAGPIFAEVFSGIWQVLGKPREGKDLLNIQKHCQSCGKPGIRQYQNTSLSCPHGSILKEWKRSSPNSELLAA